MVKSHWVTFYFMLILSFLKRVLTAEFCNGCKINNVEEIKRQGLSLKDVSLCDESECIVLLCLCSH